MGVLDVEVERARDRVLAVGDVSKVGATPSIGVPWSMSVFWSRKLKPKMPKASGLASSFWTIRLSFSPAST